MGRAADCIKGFPRPLTVGEVYSEIVLGRGYRRSPYEAGYGRCGKCCVWFRLSEVDRDRLGWPKCPICGRRLRLHGHNSRRGREMPWEVEADV